MACACDGAAIDELQSVYGMITSDELETLVKAKVTVSALDGKKDRFPSRNRPALVFLWLHEAVFELSDPNVLGLTPPAHMVRGAAVCMCAVAVA